MFWFVRSCFILIIIYISSCGQQSQAEKKNTFDGTFIKKENAETGNNLEKTTISLSSDGNEDGTFKIEIYSKTPEKKSTCYWEGVASLVNPSELVSSLDGKTKLFLQFINKNIIKAKIETDPEKEAKISFCSGVDIMIGEYNKEGH